MGRSMKEWEKEIEKLAPKDLEPYLKALETLENWPPFKHEFGWTNIFMLETLIDLQIQANDGFLKPHEPGSEPPTDMKPPVNELQATNEVCRQLLNDAGVPR